MLVIDVRTRRDMTEFGMLAYIDPATDPVLAVMELLEALTRTIELHDLPENVAWRERRNHG